MPRMRNLLQNLALTFVTLVLFFGGIEIALRVTGIDRGRPRVPPLYQKSQDPQLSYELKPHLEEKAFRATVITDSHGFRSKEPETGKPTIALLGDSITFGYGVENEETLGARLDEIFEGKFNIITAAAPGYTLGQEAALYRQKVAQLEPQTLVLVFYWNDLKETEPSVLDNEGNLQGAGWVPQQWTCNPIQEGLLGMLPGRCWLDLHSAFYRTVKKVISAKTERQNLRAQETEYRANAFLDSATDAQLAQYTETLKAFASTLPAELRKLFVIWPEKQPHLSSSAALRDIAQSQGFAVLNLYEIFGNRPESLSWDTVHPSAKTLEEAATVIKAALEEWKLVPQS